MDIKAILVGWIILCLGTVANSELPDVPCDTNIYLEVGKQGTVPCRFQDFQFLAWINGEEYGGESIPIISLDNGKKQGEGYDSGDYDISPDGSLIINNVQLKHEFNFTVSYTPNVGLRMVYFVPVSVYVRPGPEYPLVNGLTNQQYIYQEVEFYSGSINCTMNGVRPGVDLEWVYQSDVISMENEPSSVTNNTDGTYNTSLSSRYTIRDPSVSKITLQCKVAGEMADLFPTVTTINLLNLNRHFPIVNGEANQQHLVLQLNKEDEVTCSLDRVLQGVSLEWVILSPKDEVMLDSEISKIDNGDGTFNITLRSEFIEIGPSVHHVVLQCGVSGPEVDRYPDVTTVDVLLAQTLLIPVIDGCYSQQEDCNLTMPRNGTLACSVLAVPLKYRMDISLDISADASGLSLTRVKDHHHHRTNVDIYDLTTSYQYTVDEGSTESVIKCSLSGINNQPMDSRATARIIWQDTLYKEKSIVVAIIIIIIIIIITIIIIIIIVTWKKLLKTPAKHIVHDSEYPEDILMGPTGEGTQESRNLLDPENERDIADGIRTDEETQESDVHLDPQNERDIADGIRTDEETQESSIHLDPQNEEDIADGIRTDETQESSVHLDPENERGVAMGIRTYEETQESIGHLVREFHITQSDVRGMLHHIIFLLEHQHQTEQHDVKRMLCEIISLLKRQPQAAPAGVNTILRRFIALEQPIGMLLPRMALSRSISYQDTSHRYLSAPSSHYSSDSGMS